VDHSPSATTASAVCLTYPRWRVVLGWAAPLVIIAVGAAAYANSLWGEFVFDDKHDIVENTSIRHLWPMQQLLIAGSQKYLGVHNRPVVNVSFALNYALGGLHTLSYHLTNLAIHLWAGLLLFGIVRRTLLLPPLAERWGRTAVWPALSVALLWTVHPLQTEAITYVVQRYESMMGLFYFLALYAAIRCGTSSKPLFWAMLTVVATLLALGSKEVAISLPIMILLYDRALLAGSFREAWRRRWGLYLGLLAAWAFFIAWQLQVPKRPWAGYRLPVTWYAYALSQPGVILHYLRLSLWPGSLCLDYDWPVAQRAVEIIPPLLVILGLLTGSVYTVYRLPGWGLLGGWFFMILAPTSSIMPIADLAFEHRMYLPLAGVITAVVIGGDLLLGALLRRPKMPEPRRAVLHGTSAVILVALATVAMGARTWLRNEDYRTEMSIWQSTVRQSPLNARAYCGLALALASRGQHDLAIAHYQKAVEVDPEYADGHYNFGIALARHGRIEEAIVQYRRALEIVPDYSEAHNNLGLILLEKRQVDRAIACFKRALDSSPDYAEAHNNLGFAFYRARHTKDAIAECSTALELDPTLAEARYNLGLALHRQGQNEKAISQFTQALQFKPEYADAHYELARVQCEQGDLPDAMAHLREASRLRPENAMFANTAAWLLATCAESSLRNGAEAVSLARRAMEHSSGQDPLFLDTLAVASAEAGLYSQAVQTARQALELASRQSNGPLADEVRHHLALFERQTPLREGLLGRPKATGRDLSPTKMRPEITPTLPGSTGSGLPATVCHGAPAA